MLNNQSNKCQLINTKLNLKFKLISGSIKDILNLKKIKEFSLKRYKVLKNLKIIVNNVLIIIDSMT